MSDLAKFIEHTILKPDTTLTDARRVCDEAKKHEFAAVCIPPLFVREARRVLGDDTRIRLATVVGFPMGYSAIPAKSEEIKRALEEGADDIDAVVNIAAVKSGNWNHVQHDIEGVALATHMRGRTLKIILECGFLTPDEIKKIAEIAANARVAWLKTGTGFHGFPATPDMVRQLRAAAPEGVKIKAAGGIRTAEIAKKLLDAGADRLGTSASLEIIGAAK
jgi:deoxyribose-phosphate aldolase